MKAEQKIIWRFGLVGVWYVQGRPCMSRRMAECTVFSIRPKSKKSIHPFTPLPFHPEV